jgi:hypothetical protein
MGSTLQQRCVSVAVHTYMHTFNSVVTRSEAADGTNAQALQTDVHTYQACHLPADCSRFLNIENKCQQMQWPFFKSILSSLDRQHENFQT